MADRAVAKYEGAAVSAPGQWSENEVTVLKDTVAKGLTDAEFRFFGQLCANQSLDPFQRQIYAIPRGTGERRTVTFQVGIDGYRLIGHRTGQVDGIDPPQWCGPEGEWKDVWLEAYPPSAARVALYKKGHTRPYVGQVTFKEYAQKGRDGNLMGLWATMPANQLAKCAEAQAWRKAFPAEVAGLYVHEEMAQAGGTYIVEDEDGEPVVMESEPIEGEVLDADGNEVSSEPLYGKNQLTRLEVKEKVGERLKELGLNWKDAAAFLDVPTASGWDVVDAVCGWANQNPETAVEETFPLQVMQHKQAEPQGEMEGFE